jgi:hypothetical protein
MATSLLSTAASQVLGAGSNVASAIASGGFASNMATNVTGGLGSLATSLSGVSSGVAGSISGIAGGAGNAISSFANGLSAAGVDLKTGKIPALEAAASSGGFKSQIESIKGLAGSAFGTITDAFKPLKAGIPQDLKAIAQKNAAEQAANDTRTTGTLESLPGDLAKAQAAIGAASANIPGLSGVIGNFAGSVPALGAGLTSIGTSLTSGGGLSAGLTSLGSSLNSGGLSAGLTSLSSSLSSGSGLGALPGGGAAAYAFVNNATGASLSLPSLSGITSAAKNASTSILNGIPSANALSSIGTSLSVGNSAISGLINNLSSNLPDLTKNISAGTQSLSSLASTGLSAGAAASLTASLNSLSASGANPIKMPTVAVNTTDRSEITTQVSNLLGDKKIPAPDFSGSGPNASASSIAELVRTKRAEYFLLLAEYEKQQPIRQAEIEAEGNKYLAAKNTLPQGDPELASMKATGIKNIEIYSAWLKDQKTKLEAKRIEVNELQRAEGRAIFDETSAAARQ